MNQFPQAFHISWGVYGGRLHGSPKPFVDMDHNLYGTPLPESNPAREAFHRKRMKQDRVRLTPPQRRRVEESIRELATRYTWTIHAIAIQSDHAHVVITALREGPALRDALKATASRALNRQFEKQTWWAEGGSAKYLWERDYFENAVDYVLRQRDHCRPRSIREPSGSAAGVDSADGACVLGA